MTVNNVGSNLLNSYLEKQSNAATQKNIAVQSPAASPVAAQPVTQDVQSTPKQQPPEQISIQQPAKKKISKKVVIAGVCAAIAIAGIIIFALCSRKKPEISPELQNSLQELVDTANDFLTF